MDADLEQGRGVVLQQSCEVDAAAFPEPVRDTKGLQRDVALEVEEGRQQRRDRRVSSGDPGEIAARGLDEIRGGCKCLAGNLSELGMLGAGLAEPLADLMSHDRTEISMIEDRGGQVAAKNRIACGGCLRLLPDDRPEILAGRISLGRHGPPARVWRFAGLVIFPRLNPPANTSQMCSSRPEVKLI